MALKAFPLPCWSCNTFYIKGKHVSDTNTSIFLDVPGEVSPSTPSRREGSSKSMSISKLPEDNFVRLLRSLDMVQGRLEWPDLSVEDKGPCQSARQSDRRVQTISMSAIFDLDRPCRMRKTCG